MDEAARPFDELASIVAHELLAPLTVIGSAATLLDSMTDDEVGARPSEDAREMIATLRRNVDLAQLIVEGLRTDGDDGSDITVRRQATDVARLARQVVSDLRRTVLRDHPAEVDGVDVAVAEVDPRRVRQVLFNLLSNAAKYSPEDRLIRVTVRLEGDAVELLVHDRGHGVAPADAERIFGKWERASGATSGLGLGLHLSRAIARAHGGELRLERPAEGDGSIFLVSLPRGRADT